MIDENALLLYKNHITTLQNTSKDTANNDSMTDSKISVYNFDNIKRNYAKKRCRNKNAVTSVDAIYKCTTNGDFIFIEFKNGRINDNMADEVADKIKDSLLIFCDITKCSISETRKHMDFILVYNQDKESYSRKQISSHISNKAGETFIDFGLKKYKNIYFKEVYTYSKEIFNTEIDKLLI